MPFIPNTDEDRKIMLERIGASDFSELIAAIPEEIRLKKDLDMPPQLSEQQAFKYISDLAKSNIAADSRVCFMGGGAYDHYVPAIVSTVLERSEFKTAYTPYQAEVSQGTLQAMYEFQSMICELTGMEAANASLYDGGGALAEAILMAHNFNKRAKVLYAGKINPRYTQTVETICDAKNITFDEISLDSGSCDIDRLEAAAGEEVCAVVVQQPNVYGLLEDVRAIEKIAHTDKKTLFIVVFNPISLGLLEAPGKYGADVAVGEGQPLGLPLSFGGPYLGLFAASKKFVRLIPGRIAGVTQDLNGDRGFVLTLQTREQQIKREKATSNICTNQGLCMLAATVYMAALGKSGLREVAEQCYDKAHYLAEKIDALSGFSVNDSRPFFNEFFIEAPVDCSIIVSDGAEAGFMAGIDTKRYSECKPGLLVAVTEKRSKDELDAFVDFLKTFEK